MTTALGVVLSLHLVLLFASLCRDGVDGFWDVIGLLFVAAYVFIIGAYMWKGLLA